MQNICGSRLPNFAISHLTHLKLKTDKLYIPINTKHIRTTNSGKAYILTTKQINSTRYRCHYSQKTYRKYLLLSMTITNSMAKDGQHMFTERLIANGHTGIKFR